MISLGKTKRGYKELDQLQRIKRENEKLKRELSSLRKNLARLDLDRYEFVREIIEEHEKEAGGQEILQNLKESWRCYHCKTGYLEIVLYTKNNSTWYFRTCNQCENRTKSKLYTPNVKGVIKEKKT